MSAVDILKATQQRTEPVRCECRSGAYWRNLANTIEPSMCGGSAAFCQITGITCWVSHTYADWLLAWLDEYSYTDETNLWCTETKQVFYSNVKIGHLLNVLSLH